MDWSPPKYSWLFAAHLPTLSITRGGQRRMGGVELIINNELESGRESESRESSVSAATTLNWTVRGLNPGRGKYFTFKNVQTGSGALTASYSVGTRVLPGGLGG